MNPIFSVIVPVYKTEKYLDKCVTSILTQSFENLELILVDDLMPRMTGVETMEELRKIDGFKTPVVILTANAISGMKEEYLKKGFDDYLSKPIEKPELERVLKKFLNK